MCVCGMGVGGGGCGVQVPGQLHGGRPRRLHAGQPPQRHAHHHPAQEVHGAHAHHLPPGQEAQAGLPPAHGGGGGPGQQAGGGGPGRGSVSRVGTPPSPHPPTTVVFNTIICCFICSLSTKTSLQFVESKTIYVVIYIAIYLSLHDYYYSL